MTGSGLTRRRALLSVGVVAASGLAGCSGFTGGGDDDDGDGAGGGGQPTTDGGGGSTGGGSADGTGGTTAAGGELAAFALRPVATGFDAPIDLAVAPGSELRYVADQTGVVYALDPDGSTAPLLDVSDQVIVAGESGVLGLALHPEFEENRKLYVRYSSPTLPGTPSSFDHTFVLSEFVADADGRGVDPESERRVLTIPEPQGNHNAGSIAFGPDGYLYVGVGDGGGAGDSGTGHAGDWYRANPGGNGQDVADNLLGSILRIDVDGRESDREYGIPEDNPLVGEVGLDEHWAWGFRNPWRMSFDGEDLYVGDVGQNAYEEVDLVRRGGNYGWNVKEGTHCYGASSCPDETADGAPLVDPIVEYPHSDAPVSGISVIGGYRYRGDSLPGLAGAYVFGDWMVEGRLFVAEPPDGDGLWPTRAVPIAGADAGRLQQLLSFGRDEEDRLYALGTGQDGGGVFELRAAG